MARKPDVVANLAVKVGLAMGCLAVLCSMHLNFAHVQTSQALPPQSTDRPASPPSPSPSRSLGSPAGAAETHTHTHTLWPPSTATAPQAQTKKVRTDVPGAACSSSAPAAPRGSATRPSSSDAYLPYLSTYLSAFLVSPPPPLLFHLLLQSTGRLLLRGGGEGAGRAGGGGGGAGDSKTPRGGEEPPNEEPRG